MSDDTTALVLALATENAELRAALAEAQELLIETAVDAGEVHACVEELQAELTKMLVVRSCRTARKMLFGSTSQDREISSLERNFLPF
ncbi:hypothetical protein [Methylobacterium sp. WL116]|uniref:hypothetical protein n=1 Tax=Methylobacterium sp. WL116 TaxID=2603889 RepID=UPI0011CB1355|nr:hypothetical protein [Methylobacterium sp. WL116]TXM91266.1 hypothetical protein FV223_15780 [Methylobacterium sp. WL116]